VESIVVGSFTPSVLLDVAASTGRLAEHDLVVTEVPVGSSPGQFRSLLTGELDVALTSPDNVLAYRFSPANPLGALLDARILGAVDRGLGLGLYAAPGRSAADLRGATVGVDVPTSGFALAMYALGDSLGLSRDDYDLVALGSTPMRLAALLAGECTATMLNAGNELAAEAAGCVRLAGVSEVCGPYLGTVVAVTGDAHVAAGSRLSAADRHGLRDPRRRADRGGRRSGLTPARPRRRARRPLRRAAPRPGRGAGGRRRGRRGLADDAGAAADDLPAGPGRSRRRRPRRRAA